MKKLLLFILLPSLAMLPGSLAAQTVIDQKENSLEVKSSKGKQVITILKDQDEESFSLKIGGFNINLQGKAAETKRVIAPPKYIELDLSASVQRLVIRERPLSRINVGNFQLGFIGLTTPDYSMYEDDTQGFLDLNNGRSISFAFEVIAEIPLDYRGNVWFSGGLRPRWDNYVFADPITLTKTDGMIFPQELDRDAMKRYKKSKLTTFTLDIPLTMEFKLSKNVSLGGGVYGGFVLGDYTKYKFKKVKDKGDYAINFFQAGATFRIRIWRIGAFFNYNFTPLFKNGAGPKTQPYMFGIML